MRLVAVAGAALLAACASEGSVAPSAEGPAVRFTVTSAGIEAELIEGDHGPGAHYALYRPAQWNGNLVVYAHGFVDAAAPVALPSDNGLPALRDALLGMGYGVAYSSFAENGYAFKSGVLATHELRGIFTARFHVTPGRTYLLGHSLGGLVVTALAETYPSTYAAALPMCGLVGGTRAEVDYIANLRLLFDLFYPGVLPGRVDDIPASVDLTTQVIGPAIAAIQADPTGAGAITAVFQTPVPFSSGPELVESLVRALGFNFRGFPDLNARTHEHTPFDNTGTVYTGSLPAPVLAFINGAIGRVSTTPDATNYVAHNYQPTGRIAIPVLTLHDARDPVAPMFHEVLFRQAVTAAGHADRLVQRTVPRYGHCAFETAEMTQAFSDLVNWTEHGVTPVP